MRESRKKPQEKRNIPQTGNVSSEKDLNKPCSEKGYFDKNHPNKHPHGGCGCS